MADVRALLRAERAERAVRGSAVKSKQHPPPLPRPVTQSKKRKADARLDEEPRKRPKAQLANEISEGNEAKSVQKTPEENYVEHPPPAAAEWDESASTHEQDELRDESNQLFEADPEFASFLKEMDEHSAPFPTSHAAFSGGYGTISGKALTAEELEAKQQEATAAQKSTRDEELENDKEDAARVLDEEFDQVQEMESRVSRLRAIREKTRPKQDEEPEVRAEELPPDATEQSQDEEDEEDEWDAWTFRPA